MVRQLYRIYLYVVSLALLAFAAVGLYSLLDTLLALTVLRGSYRSVPTGTDLTQQIVFAAVAWLIAGVVGGLHYRLIRRDMSSDSAAGSGAVRAFFLNLAQAAAVVIAIIAGTGAFSTLAYQATYQQPSYIPETAGAFAGMAAALLVASLLQFERSRTVPAPGLATTFQRLHLYGLPFGILLLGLAGAWDSAMKTSLDVVLIQTRLYTPVDPRVCGPYPVGSAGPIEGVCALPNAGFLWLAVLLLVAAVGVYTLFVRGDSQSIVRALTHLASFSVGVAFVLVGLDRSVELGLRALFAIPVTWSEIAHPWNAPYNFVSPATFGVLLLVVYGLWLRTEAAALPLGRSNTMLAMGAVVAALMAIPFYWGLGRALYTTFQWIASSTAFAFRAQWAVALALMITGLAYFALTQYVRITPKASPAGNAPWRALVLALLASGVVTGAVGLAVTLYAWGTWLLRAPLVDWEETARAGTAALVVGVVLAGAYGWIALRGRFVEPLMAGLGGGAKTPQEAAQAAATAQAIGEVLDEYAAHSINREQAAERILELAHQ